MTPNELRNRTQAILTKLDRGEYLDGRGVEEAEQAIYDLMLELIKDLPNSAYLESNGLRHEPVSELRKLIKEARND